MSNVDKRPVSLTGILAMITVAIGVMTTSPMASAASPTSAVDFQRDIQPIFKSACYECHGPSRQKSKLRLDSRPLAMQGGRSGKDIVPGNATQRTLLKRITDPDSAHRMPQDRDALSGEQI